MGAECATSRKPKGRILRRAVEGSGSQNQPGGTSRSDGPGTSETSAGFKVRNRPAARHGQLNSPLTYFTRGSAIVISFPTASFVLSGDIVNSVDWTMTCVEPLKAFSWMTP